MHTIQAHAGSIGRMSSAIALCFSFKTPCMKYLHKTTGKKRERGIVYPQNTNYVAVYAKKPLPLAQEQCQSEQYGLDKHSHTCQHLRHCKLQYPVDNQHPAN